jgi:hypothetical protein
MRPKPRHAGLELSPIKVVKNPDGSMQVRRDARGRSPCSAMVLVFILAVVSYMCAREEHAVPVLTGGPVQRAATTQSALAKERRELREQQRCAPITLNAAPTMC